MTTFTDKELIKEIKERIGSLDVRDNIERRAYEIALASLEAEPVAWQVTITKDGLDSASTIYRDCAEKDTWVRMHETLGSVVHVTPLYMAPPAPVIQADVAQAIENLKQKLVECNRYNYCADAVKGVEDASRVLALQNQNISAPLTSEAIENAIEFIRSIAFHINEDDYHGKHIAHYMQQALAWLEGHSCSDDRLGKADNQPVRGNQAAESNRGNEWTGNPDIDNAIIMLDRIDTAESCDDDRIEAVKAVLRRLAGNSPVTPDGWVSCSERMPDDGQHVIILCDGAFVLYAQYRDGEFFDVFRNGEEFFETQSRNVTNWMPLPEPPQEVNRG
ncbi:TPA: DUF551 domain-containing protein [Escherichia coli]|nr:DUF551 domain-containing protein [Escherichia coli]